MNQARCTRSRFDHEAVARLVLALDLDNAFIANLSKGLLRGDSREACAETILERCQRRAAAASELAQSLLQVRATRCEPGHNIGASALLWVRGAAGSGRGPDAGGNRV